LYNLHNLGIAETIFLKTSLRKIFKDIISSEEALNSFYTQPYFIALVFAIIEIPFILVSKMEKLRFVALVGVAGIIAYMITFAIIYINAVGDSDPDNNPVGGMESFPTNWLLAFANIPNSILALSYQMNFFPIFKGL
jgi:amino acid permease